MIFLDLHKVYYAFDRSSFLDILDRYGVGTRACQIIQTYWSRLRMVARAGVYSGAAFTGAQGVTQGDLLSPTIFNVMVDAVLQHRISVMMEGA